MEKISGPEKCWTKISLGKKLLGQKNIFGSEKISGLKKLLVQKNFCVRKLLGPKIFESEKILGPKLFGSKIFWGGVNHISKLNSSHPTSFIFD